MEKITKYKIPKYNDKFVTTIEDIKKIEKSTILNKINENLKEVKNTNRENFKSLLYKPKEKLKIKTTIRRNIKEYSCENVKDYDVVIGINGETLRDSIGNYWDTSLRDKIDRVMKEAEEERLEDFYIYQKEKQEDSLWKEKVKKKKKKTYKRKKKENYLVEESKVSNLFKIEDVKRERILKKKVKIEEDIVLSLEDIEYIEFIGKFKFSTIDILRKIKDRSFEGMRGILERLKTLDLIDNVPYGVLGELWFLSAKGSKIFPTIYKRMTANRLPKPTVIPPQLGVQVVASYLWNNSFNILNLKEFPYKGKEVEGKRVEGEEILTEFAIRKSWYQELQNLKEEYKDAKNIYKGFFAEKIARKKREAFLDWEKLRKEGYDLLSPEFIEGMEFCWAVYPDDTVATSITYHNPDLVVVRERENGEARSIAIEVERKIDSIDTYVETFNAYKTDRTTYHWVIWLTDNITTKRLLEEAGRITGFKNFTVLPFRDKEGKLIKNLWRY